MRLFSVCSCCLFCYSFVHNSHIFLYKMLTKCLTIIMWSHLSCALFFSRFFECEIVEMNVKCECFGCLFAIVFPFVYVSVYFWCFYVTIKIPWHNCNLHCENWIPKGETDIKWNVFISLCRHPHSIICNLNVNNATASISFLTLSKCFFMHKKIFFHFHVHYHQHHTTKVDKLLFSSFSHHQR